MKWLHVRMCVCLVVVFFTLASCAHTVSTDSNKQQIEQMTLDDVSFPAKVSLAALANSDDVRKVSMVALKDCPIDQQDPIKSNARLSEVIESLKKEGSLSQLLSSLNDKDLDEAIALVKSGKFKQDIQSSIEQIYQINQDVPFKLLRELNENRHLLTDLLTSFNKDLAENPGNLLAIPLCTLEFSRYLLNQTTTLSEQCRPERLTKTLTAMHDDSSVSEITKTARVFTHKDNRSGRLALLTYARINGITLTENDLDSLDGVLQSDTVPDLTVLAKQGLMKISEQGKIGDIQTFVKGIKLFDSECNSTN